MMTNARRSALLAVLATALAGGSARAGDPVVSFERYRLDNGLEVILHQDNRVPLVAVDVWYHVGSGNEVVGKSGFAHLFEHMLFQGSKHVGEDRHFDVLKNVGASSVNGTTSSDRTNYFEVVPSHQIETALWLESDRMGYFLPLLTQKSLDNQIEVVRNERRQRVDNVPYGPTRFATAAALYPEGHPYRYLTIGRHEDLESANLEDVIQFFKTWYVPANATLVMAGDFELDQAKALVDKWFGTFPVTTAPPRPQAPEVTRAKSRTELKDSFAKLRRIDHVWHSPAFYAPGDAELDVLSHALGASGTGRLYKILVHEKQLAQSVRVYQASAQFSSTFNVQVTVKSDADLAEIERIMTEEVERVRTEGITQKELDRARVNIESGFVWGLEHLMARAELLQRYNHYLGDPGSITVDLDRYRNTSVDKIKEMAVAYLNPESRVEILTTPAPDSGEKTSSAAKGGK